MGMTPHSTTGARASINKHWVRNVKIDGALKCVAGAAQHCFAQMRTDQLHSHGSPEGAKPLGRLMVALPVTPLCFPSMKLVVFSLTL
jgi:hypothetical protein